MVTAAHWRFILINQTLVSIFMNFLMNGVMAWLVFKGRDNIVLWGENNAYMDLVATTFFFTFFTCFLVSKASYRAIDSGKLARVESDFIASLLKAYPPKPLIGSLIMALMLALLVPPILVMSFYIFSNLVISHDAFILLKAFYGAGLALIATPLVCLIALAEAKDMPNA